MPAPSEPPREPSAPEPSVPTEPAGTGAAPVATETSVPAGAGAAPVETGTIGPDGGAAAEPPEQAPRSSYELPNRRNTSVRNMVWALVVIMVGVAAGAVAFFGVGTDLGREVPETSRLDVAESAERARGAVDFPVAEPALDAGWTAREARLSASDPASWELEYTAPSGSLITLQEQAEVGAPMLSAALPGTVVELETTIDGADCQVLSADGEEQTGRGMSCQGEGWGILVHGDAEDAELRALMEAAIASLG